MKPERISAALQKIRGRRIAVVGDFILDEYLIGETGRVSREAPVVVVDYRDSIHRPGGAANAAVNVASMGGVALPIGVVGTDEKGRILQSLLCDRGIDTSTLETREDVATALKMRIVAGDLHAQKQQVARVDRMHKIGEGHEALVRCEKKLLSVIDEIDGVLVSDYGSGAVGASLGRFAVERARERGLPIVVDSRYDLLGLPGATAGTPNEVEALEALGLRKLDYRIDEVAEMIVEKAKFESLLITRGKKGMFVRTESGEGVSLGIVGPDQVADVTGAGDTVAAAVTLVLSAGGGILEGAELATCAAAVVVGKWGTADASAEEIESVAGNFLVGEKDEG